jgi:hypothetical protein
LSKGTRFGLIGGAAAVLLLTALGLSGVFPSGGTPSTKHSDPATSAPPPFPVQQFTDERGFSINVPADWTKSGSGKSYLDFTDPQDNGRRIRVNVESAGSTPKAFLQVVSNVLSKDPRKCPTPYTTLNLRSDVTLGGRPAAELEYTCGTGPDMRHGLWRAAVVNGKAYEFYMSVEDSRFTESRDIFEYAASTYKLNPTG